MIDDNRKIEENNSWNRLSMWETIVDERIRKVIGDGNMSWHPGAGQPFHLESDEHIPEDSRIAYKLMKEQDAVPPWIALAFTLRDKHEKIIQRVTQYAQDYIRRRRDALIAGSFVQEQHARDRWKEACQRLREDVGRYNSELLDYNLQIPATIPQMVPLNPENLIDGALRQAEKSLNH
jgi:hypothetical protein